MLNLMRFQHLCSTIQNVVKLNQSLSETSVDLFIHYKRFDKKFPRLKLLSLTPSKPLAPSPVTLYKHPSLSPIGPDKAKRAVVAKRTSRFFPPNATDVTCLDGNCISSSILPVLNERLIYLYVIIMLYFFDYTYVGLIFRILELLKAATYKYPSVSMVIPSAKNSGFLSATEKLITMRSFAV